MNTGNLNIKFSIMAIFWALALTVFAQDDLISKVKTIEKVFDESGIEYVGITNSFGDIDISYWDNDKVKMTITVKVIAWEDDDAERFIEKLIPESKTFECKCSGKAVYSATDYSHIKKLCGCDGEKKVYAPWFKKNAEVKQFSVNYDVKIPASVNIIDLSNRFGNINIPDFEGTLSINLSNGNLKAGGLKMQNSSKGVRARYGKVHIESIENSKIDLYSCKDVQIGNLAGTNLISKFSDIHISSCRGLTLNSKSDNITIGRLESLEGRGIFTSLEIDNFTSVINFYNKSGEIEIRKTNPDFKTISLDGQFNDYILNLNTLGYSLTADLEFTDLKAPDAIYPEQKRKELINGKASFKIEVGNQPGVPQVLLKCSNCNVDLH